jgi:hypothetical protein
MSYAVRESNRRLYDEEIDENQTTRTASTNMNGNMNGRRAEREGSDTGKNSN